MIDGIRVYEINKLVELKTEAFINRDKERDIYDVAFLLHRYPHAISTETLDKIVNKVDSIGIDHLAGSMREDNLLLEYDTDAIVLSLDENIDKYLRLNSLEKTKEKSSLSRGIKKVELYAAEPDRVYRGEIICIQDDSILQEISPGVAIEHRGIAAGMSLDDVGKNFSIAYDTKGAVKITQEKSRDRGNGIDR